MKHYFARIGIALSVLFNVIFGGYSNQTFSARNYEWKRNGKYHIVPVIDFMFREKGHCSVSWSYWITRKY